MKRKTEWFRYLVGWMNRRASSRPEERRLREGLEGLNGSPDLLLRELTPRTDCPDEESFLRFLSGQCSRVERDRILDHVTDCHACLAAVDDLIGPASARARENRMRGRTPSSRRRSRARWAWGVGLTAPAAALCVLLAVLFAAPAVEMNLEVMQSALRTEGDRFVKDGGLLHEGDSFRLEVSAREGGFFFLVAWNPSQGGKFIFPVPGVPDENRIEKGQTRLVPDRQGWRLEDVVPGEESLFLLFSEHPVDREELARKGRELEGAGKALPDVERFLQRDFSVEQRITYRVE